MRRFTRLFILMLSAGLILGGCFSRRVAQKEYVTIRDTIIKPEVVKLDTITKFEDRFIYLKDTTNQMFVTIEKVRDNYIKVKAKCEPKTIIVPVSKTITKTKQVVVENLLWKHIAIALLLVIAIYIVSKRILPKGLF